MPAGVRETPHGGSSRISGGRKIVGGLWIRPYGHKPVWEAVWHRHRSKEHLGEAGASPKGVHREALVSPKQHLIWFWPVSLGSPALLRIAP